MRTLGRPYGAHGLTQMIFPAPPPSRPPAGGNPPAGQPVVDPLHVLAGPAREPRARLGHHARRAPGLPGARDPVLVHPGAALHGRRRRVAAGLVMDVADATVFGQHALAYAVLAYAAEYFRRRVLRFPVVAAGAAGRRAARAVRGARAAGALRRRRGDAARGRISCRAFVGALLWPLLSALLQWPQRPARSRAEL